MNEKKLIYKPKALKKLKISSLYFFSLISDIALISFQFVLGALRTPASVDYSQKHINNFAKVHFDATGTTLYATGLENFDVNKTYVFISNHESWMDIPAILTAVPQKLRMVAKEGLVKIPVFGKAMLDGGFIIINRKNRAKAIKQLEIAKEKLQQGISIWIAPEGTRSRTNEIGDFKKGGFYLALELGLPIIPVFIEGAAKVMPPDSVFITTNQDITVHFLEAQYEKDLNILIKKVRDKIINKRNSLRNEHDSSK